MDIAIIGANGDVGRALALRIVSGRLLSPQQRLQLVGRAEGDSARALHGLRVDLYDGYAEVTPEIDVALSPREVAADLILFCAGRTIPTGTGPVMSRHELGAANAPVFEAYARSLAEHGHGQELVVVVGNPVELGVDIFARYLGRHRVIGMGAYLDSARLRREIAADLGVRRQRVQAYMMGEHGDALLPVLSQMWIYGFDEAENQAARERIIAGRSVEGFAQELAHAKGQIVALLAQGQVEPAFRLAQTQPPDLRAVLMPLISHVSGAKTAISTAAITAELAQQILDGGQSVIPAQVSLSEHDWFGPAGVLGVPVICGLRGWSSVTDLKMSEPERQGLLAAAQAINTRVEHWRHG